MSASHPRSWPPQIKQHSAAELGTRCRYPENSQCDPVSCCGAGCVHLASGLSLTAWGVNRITHRMLMTPLHIKQIATVIQRDYAPQLDLTDVASRPPQELAAVTLSRGLAAMAARYVSGCSIAEAAGSVIDGFGDNGIDAVAVDEEGLRVVVVQAKWHERGNKNIDLGDAHKFLAGLKSLINLDFGSFNEKLSPIAAGVEDVLSQPGSKIELVVASTGASQLSSEVAKAFEDVCTELNEPGEIADLTVLGLSEIYRFLTEAIDGAGLNLDVTLQQWGMLTEPYEAFYGTVSASSVGGWYEQHGDRLFDRNIRRALGGTTVNTALVDTLCSRPHEFWYFNNGITVLCEEIDPAVAGAPNRNSRLFRLQGVSVVNGAQTVASINAALRKSPDSAADAQVWVRLISLEGCPESFGTEVTRATNTQNAVENRDFVSLDPEQTRLRHDLMMTLGKVYAIKRGGPAPADDGGCSVVDAAVALACAQDDTALAVYAKANVGRLWASTDAPPYTTLFNKELSAVKMWRSVQVLRRVEAVLDREQRRRTGRLKAIAIQGNRIVTHLVFCLLDLSGMDDPLVDWTVRLEQIPESALDVLVRVTDVVESDFAENYVTSLFKNISKCRYVVAAVKEGMEI
jgi:hypothetical protein